MTAANDFLSEFDDQGRYRKGDGVLDVTFLTPGGKYPGKLHFSQGNLVRAEMDGASSWVFPENAPLDGIRFQLQFDGDAPLGILVDQGRLRHRKQPRPGPSKNTFLENLRIARNLFFHPRVEADHPGLDPETLSRMVSRAALWLTPRSVAGFSAADFPELSLERQGELATAIREFQSAAREVPPDKSATREQLGNATVAFTKVLEILKPYLVPPQEGAVVEEALRKVGLPEWAVNWDYEFGSDKDGIPAVWVTVFVDENSVPRRDLGRFASQLTTKLLDALTEAGSERWPYVRVRLAIEHKTA
jgi:hypothetical protein